MPVRAAITSVLTTAVVAVAVATGAGAAVATNDPLAPDQWNLAVIGAEAGWAVDAEPVTIAIVDTGIDLDHEDLAAHLVAGRDLVDGDDDPSDEEGHGTHVAGIAAAITDNGRGVAAVAPRARIMPVRVLDEHGEGTARTVTEGVRWAVDHGARVVNLSLGAVAASVVGNGLESAVRYAWDNGAVAVVAAGNDYVLSSGFGDEPAVVVTATTEHDTQPDYSNGVGRARWGIAAPGGGGSVFRSGRGVVSTWWDGIEPNRYAWASGTSMAAPHVSGALAVLLGAGLTPSEAVDRLLATAKDLGAPGRDDTFGAGRLDVAAATRGLSATATTSPPTPVGKAGSAPEPEPTPPPAVRPSTTTPRSENPPRSAANPATPDDADEDSPSGASDPIGPASDVAAPDDARSSPERAGGEAALPTADEARRSDALTFTATALLVVVAASVRAFARGGRRRLG